MADFQRLVDDLTAALQGIAEDHPEVVDSEVRENIAETLNVYFIWSMPLTRFPSSYASESPECDHALGEAMETFLVGAVDLADAQGIPPGQRRLEILTTAKNGGVTSLGGFLGVWSGLIPPEVPGPERFGGQDDALDGELWEVRQPLYEAGSNRLPLGASGPGPLENKDAVDLMEELVVGETTLEHALAGWRDTTSFREAFALERVAVAAAELIARKVSSAPPSDQSTALALSMPARAVPPRETAAEAVRTILQRSALRDAWVGSGRGDEWLVEMNRVLRTMEQG